MEIRSKATGPNAVWVELAFKTEGKLKDFIRVELWIREGEKFLVNATLKENPHLSKPERPAVGLTIDRSLLSKSSLVVVEGRPALWTAYEVRLKDFVPAELLRKEIRQ
jgi:hypothetical protein